MRARNGEKLGFEAMEEAARGKKNKEIIKSQVEQAKTLTNYHKLHNN